jgi:hypothetical protein
VTGLDPLLYTIIFENKSTATAAAQKVVVKDQLDSNLDWSTLELVSIGFNNKTIDVPAGLQSYSTTANVATDINPVKVTADLNPATGLMTWTMESFDPVTGVIPEDPYAGFLPPNDATHRGEGIVTLRIRPKSGLANGTSITNKAQIFFDANPVIETNVVSNTIDLTAPTSTVNSLPTTGMTTAFTVNWGGSDNTGSGVASYYVYVSTDGGAYLPWLTGTTDTSATYTGTSGHTYGFYSVSTDNVGHRQVSPTTAQATTSRATPTLADALKAIRGVYNLTTLTPEEKVRYDLAPLGSNGLPMGNGVVDIADVILILRRSIDIGAW